MKDLKSERLNYSKSLKDTIEKAVSVLSRLDEVEKVNLAVSFSRRRASFKQIMSSLKKEYGG